MSFRIKLMILTAGLASCQSARFAVPATEAYRPTVRSRQAAPVTASPPALLAALPKPTSKAETEDVYAKQLPNIASTTPQILAPDTVLKPTVTPAVSGKPDPTTTVVNIAGAVITAAGLGVIIANSGEAPHTEWGGLSQSISILGGIIMALFGLVLLFFQGKNGRMRRLREARKAAASPTPGQSPAVTPDPVKPSSQTSHKQKTGLRLMVAGGIMGLLGYLASGPFLLLLPVAAVLLLIGSIVSITGH